MLKEDYIKTLDVNGIKVDLGLDDYGQCYIFEYKDSNGNVVEDSCGGYNSDYMGVIYYALDPVYREIWSKEVNELTDQEKDLRKHYDEIFAEEYKVK